MTIRGSITTGITVILLVLSTCRTLPAEDNQESELDADKQAAALTQFEGKALYTTANIFYEKPGKILSTNYHKGRILPAGSRVTIAFARGREIEFKDEKGAEYRIILKRKHTSPTMSLPEYFKQYFSAENPLRPGGPYDAFTESERWSIKNGTIEKGMCRAAVLMAYGYPPSHATPSLKDDKWTRWIGRLHGQPVYVYFRNDRVYKIANSQTLSSD